MKTKKKLIKKLNFLNRNTHINYYDNYLIYSYLNNYNLKLYFYYLIKKKQIKKISNYYNKFYTYLNSRYLVLINNFYIEKNFNFLFNYKNKYFFNNFSQNNKFIYSNKLKLSSSKNNYKYNTNKFNFYIYKIVNKNYFNIYFIYNTLFILFYLLNLIKIYDFYKSFINFMYFNV